MEKQIAIKKTDINWLEIIQLAFNKKGWGTTYTLYVYGEVSISVVMNTFDFKNNIASFEIRCHYPEDEYSDRYCSYDILAYHLDNYSLDFFGGVVLKKIRNLLESVISNRTKSKAEELYEELKYHEVTDEMITQYDYQDEYDAIQIISYDKYKDLAMDSFEEEILDMVNSSYNIKVSKYVSENNECSDNMLKLLEEIIKLIETKVPK